MRSTDDQTAIEEWQAARSRVVALVGGLGDELLGTHVPACPDWTVRDLLSHMVGLGADVVAGDEPDDHNATWTQAQVDARANRTAAELLDEWAEVAPRLVSWMEHHGVRPLNDVVIHEQDLRSALGRPGGRETLGFRLVRERMLERFAAIVETLPPLTLVGHASDGTGWRWSSDHDAQGALVEASSFDLSRALTSRRTAEQLRGWTVRGDVTPFLGAFARLGPLPREPLPE
ncbi:MAG: maleylpyruvate isomerase family mycothiol-dependent enzyme [Nocardioidaceae bacterium]|nr:maleylpyruvate isomerase family mycothiol-dependent enzyme [Nocardioidaceae bacterium]NUS52957.1 maleylpyruvate isomerase family mycothiol-dependent enzyme [Nocardioidaceae bacterium]